MKSGSGKKIALVLGLVGLVVLGGLAVAGWYYFGTTGTKVASKAHVHLPADCEVVVRIDLAKVMKVEPVKEHVVSAIEEVMKEEGGGRLAAFLVAARMNPKTDLKSMAVCLNDVSLTGSTYGLVVGGELLDENGVVTALDRHDGSDDFNDPEDVGKLRVLKSREDGTLVSQSPKDAALLFSEDQDMLESIAAKSDAFEAYDIPMDEQMSAVVSAEALKGILSSFGPFLPQMGDLEKAERIVVTMTLDPGELGVRMIFPDAAQAEAAKGQLQTLLTALAAAPIGPTADPEVKSVLRAAKIKSKKSNLEIRFPIADESIEDTCEELGEEIRKQNE